MSKTPSSPGTFGRALQRPIVNAEDYPGPQYSIRERIGRDAKKIGFTKGTRPPLYSTVKTPSAQDYEIPPLDQVTRQITFPRDERFREKKIDKGSPGPALMHSWKSDSASYSFGVRSQDRGRYNGALLSVAKPNPIGPDYDVKWSPKANSKVYRPPEAHITTGKRMDVNGTIVRTPAPNQYEVKTETTSQSRRFQSAHFGTSKRDKLYDTSERSPGLIYSPNYKYQDFHTPASQWGKSKVPKDPTKSAVKKPTSPEEFIGPGKYDPEKFSRKVPNIFLVGKPNYEKKQPKNPAPNAYTIDSTICKETPRYSFPKEGQPRDHVGLPGRKLSDVREKRYLGYSLKVQIPPNDIPGPGQYDVDKSSQNHRVQSQIRRSPAVTFKRPNTVPNKKRKSISEPNMYYPGLHALSQSRRVGGVTKWKKTPSSGPSFVQKSSSPGPKYLPKQNYRGKAFFEPGSSQKVSLGGLKNGSGYHRFTGLL